MGAGNHKEIKLQPKYRKLCYSSKIVPWLSLNGVWLEKLGFKAGDTVKIFTDQKRLIIELSENQEKPAEKKHAK